MVLAIGETKSCFIFDLPNSDKYILLSCFLVFLSLPSEASVFRERFLLGGA